MSMHVRHYISGSVLNSAFFERLVYVCTFSFLYSLERHMHSHVTWTAVTGCYLLIRLLSQVALILAVRRQGLINRDFPIPNISLIPGQRARRATHHPLKSIKHTRFLPCNGID